MSDSKKTPDPEPPLPTAEPAPPDAGHAGLSITAWHYLLIQALEALLSFFGGQELLIVKPFFKLGTLPLEADLIVQLKHLDGAALAELLPDFAFMLRYLAWLTIVEYKGPDDSLTHGNFNTAVTYAFMARHKHLQEGKLPPLSQMCLQVLYSHKEKGLLERLEKDRFPFVKVEDGVLRCDTLPMPIYLLDLARLSDRDPAALINLFSSRHRRFALHPEPDPARRAVLEKLYYTVMKELPRMLSQEKIKDLPGAHEVIDDLSELRRQFIASLTPEERLAGLAPQERLAGLAPQERLAGLAPQELQELQARIQALLNNGSGARR